MNASPKLEQLLVRQDSTFRDALEAIDQNAQGSVIVVDSEQRLVGVMTDGDVRRAILNGASLATPIKVAIQRDCVFRPLSSSPEELVSLFSSGIKVIPLIDNDSRVKDYASPHRLHTIPVLEPSLSGNELAYVTECLRTGWVSSQGPFVRRFEKEFAAYCGAEYALAVSNGTVALHLALASLGIKAGDEVLVPDLTFAATANAVLYTGATPVLVDISPVTWTLDADEARKAITGRTRAIIPVHLYGHPCAMDELVQLAQENNLYLVEDCAEAIGTKYKERSVGTFGQVATFSFFGNKTITTGEGGMVLFAEEQVHNHAKRLRDHGMSQTRKYWHDEVGFNYRMTNLQAAIGVAQLERIEEFVERKREISREYNEALSGNSFLVPPPEEPWAYNSYWLYSCLLKDQQLLTRDDLLQKLLKNGVEARPLFYPLHLMPPYTGFTGNREFPVSTSIAERGFSLPSSTTLTGENIRDVVSVVNNSLSVRVMLSSHS